MTKHCFYNYEELCHTYVYAGKDDYGHVRSGNMKFEGNEVYSYSTKIAEKYPNKKIVIIDSYTHSQTTASQIYTLMHAFDSSWTIIRAHEFDIKKINSYFKNQFKLFMSKSFAKRQKDKKDTLVLSHRDDRCDLYSIYKQALTAEECKLFTVTDKIREFVDANNAYSKSLSDKAEQRQNERRETIKNEQILLKDLMKSFIKDNNLYNTLFNHKTLKENIKELQDCTAYYNNNVKLFDDFKDYVKNKIENGEISAFKQVTYHKPYYNFYITSLFYEKVFGIIADDNLIYEYSNFQHQYDLVWYDEERKQLVTNRNVYIDEQHIKGIKVLMKKYLKDPYDESLTGLHVSYYTIGMHDDKIIHVGCHKFCNKNIKLLLKDLENAGY